jgi:metal-dependent amidase/aminoacylase/carboxypeptidase family protein
MEEIISGIAESIRCQATIEINHVALAVLDDIKLSGCIWGIGNEWLPDDTLITNERTKGSEEIGF